MTSVHVGKRGEFYQLKFVIDPSRRADLEVKAVFLKLNRGMAVEAGLIHRAKLLELKKNGKIFNLPLYAVSLLSTVIASGG